MSPAPIRSLLHGTVTGSIRTRYRRRCSPVTAYCVGCILCPGTSRLRLDEVRHQVNHCSRVGLILGSVHVTRRLEGPHVGLAGPLLRAVPRGHIDRHGDTYQDTDDKNDDHQFDQGKTFLPMQCAHLLSAYSYFLRSCHLASSLPPPLFASRTCPFNVFFDTPRSFLYLFSAFSCPVLLRIRLVLFGHEERISRPYAPPDGSPAPGPIGGATSLLRPPPGVRPPNYKKLPL